MDNQNVIIVKERPAITISPDGTKIVRNVCRLCHGNCGLLVHVKNGKIVKVEGDPEHPLSQGSICPKPLAAKQIVYHPERLKYPLKRVGKRGEGKWERVSWDEALDTAADKLKDIKQKYGAEAVFTSSGPDRGNAWANKRFCNTFGTPNNMSPGGAQCYIPRLTSSIFTLGAMVLNQNVIDAEHTKCMVMWGINPLYGALHTRKHAFFDALEKGAKLIVVDPKFTNLAAKADMWLPVRPGTDCALALGFMNVIINENLYDKEFVEKWTVGFDKLVDHVKDFTPERVAEITWVPAKDIKKAARMYATTKPALLDMGVTAEHFPNSIDTSRAAAILVAITGNIDVPGGSVYLEPMGTVVDTTGYYGESSDLSLEQVEKRLGGDKYKLLGGPKALGARGHTPTSWEAIRTGKPYPVKALLVSACNVLSSYANVTRVYETLKELDFIMISDFFMTPLASLLGDILLPAATIFEKEDIWYSRAVLGLGSGASYLLPSAQAIEPVGECWDDKKIFFELAKRIPGMEKFWPWKDVRELLDSWVKPAGITYAQLLERILISPARYRKYEEKGFNTPSGKVEIYSQRFKDMGYDPLPVYREPPESPYSKPELAKEYPLVLTCAGKSPLFFHSEHRNIPWLREIHPEPLLDINTETAEKLGISNNDWVTVESPRGSIKLKARLTLGIHPKVVAAERWWYPERPPDYGWKESNVNVLTSDEPPYDPAIGTYQLRGVLCRVRKA